MSDAFGHLHPAVRRFAAMDDEIRIGRVRTKRWIEHAAAAEVLESLQEVFDQPPSERMENVLVFAESGMGKTSLVRRFERAHALAFDTQAGVARRPVVVVRMPPDPTEDEFFRQVLAALGAPVVAADRRGDPRLRELAARILREVGARVLVIDELNSVLGGTARQQRHFLQVLRFLSNELGVALVCTGVPEARHALRSDPELRSRFVDVELLPWTADDALQGFVNRLVQGLPLRQPSPVDGGAVRKLLAGRSGGITAHVCKAVERAAIAAIRSGREMIDLAALQDDRVWRGIVGPGPVTAPARLAGRGERKATL